MHEVSIIGNVLDQVLDICELNNIKKVNSVVLQVGEFSCANNTSLSFIFKILSKNTKCEDSKLVIDKIKSKAYCSNCNKEFPIDFMNKQCPICNKYSYKVTSGYELILYRIEGE